MKEIEGYDGYTITRSGNVYSCWSKTGRAGGRQKQALYKRLSPYNAGGYLQVKLINDRGSKSIKVHRLVAKAFIPNPLGLPEVNHKDKDKCNNNVLNLEWCTRQRNVEHSQSKSYTFISPEGEVTEVYNLSKFCRDNKLNISCMCLVASGKRQTHKGWSC